MAEPEKRCLAGFFKVEIAVRAVGGKQCKPLCAEAGRQIVRCSRKGDIQVAARVDFAEQHLGNRLSLAAAPVKCDEYGRRIRPGPGARSAASSA